MMLVWMVLASTMVLAQSKVDDERMQRDLQVAENILGTLIKQQFGKRQFFPMEVQASYLPGYGVTFRVPSEMFGNMFFMQEDDGSWNMDGPPVPPAPVIAGQPGSSFSYSYSTTDEHRAEEQAEGKYTKAKKPRVLNQAKTYKGRKTNTDSTSNAYHEKIMEAAKNFIADYGDLLTQLQPNEKIVVTNKSEGNGFRMTWIGAMGRGQKQNLVTVEGTKADVNQFRQGKMTREQLLEKLKVVNSEISDELQPDLELLSSIFNRLYSRDLSKTFFSDGNIYYERMKDFGAIYHMQAYSSNQQDGERYDMPTIRLQDVDQETRDKKVKELYPEFEKNIKEDMIEYGRTLKSLKDEEQLMMEVSLTRCRNCGIPSTLELAVKNLVLKDYSSGKITKEAALAKITMKKGAVQ